MKHAFLSRPARRPGRRRLALLAVTGPLVAGGVLLWATGVNLTSAQALTGHDGAATPSPAVPTATTTGPATTVRLSPESATDPTGGLYTVTARVTTTAGAPVKGARVLFAVTGANSAAGQATTSASGTATFTYHGRLSGIDTITACHDVNANKACDGGEPSALALKIWAPPLPVVPVAG